MTDDNFQTIDSELAQVTGGFALPWWVTGERFKIPAADPPGHTIERRKWMQQQREGSR
jgi:hypothetical protein